MSLPKPNSFGESSWDDSLQDEQGTVERRPRATTFAWFTCCGPQMNSIPFDLFRLPKSIEVPFPGRHHHVRTDKSLVARGNQLFELRRDELSDEGKISGQVGQQSRLAMPRRHIATFTRVAPREAPAPALTDNCAVRRMPCVPRVVVLNGGSPDHRAPDHRSVRALLCVCAKRLTSATSAKPLPVATMPIHPA